MKNKNIFYPHIEGLRGLAVILVVIYHLNNNFYFGYLGVDIFFVISGYVITKSLISSFDHNSSNVLSNFYSKRILRIYPALLFVIIITFLIYLIFGYISNYEIVLKTFVYSAFGLSNIYFLRRNNSYFQDEIDNPLIHTWSLGVEEQFYLIFPVILFFFFRYQKKLIQNKFLVFFLFFIFSLSFFYFFLENDESTKFWSPLSRFWELLVGCILCFTERNNKQNFFLIFLISITTIFNFFKFEIYDFYLSLSIIFSAFIISQNKNFVINLCFSNRYIRSIGKISYSMYLIHYPLLYFFNIYFDVSNLSTIFVYLIFLIFLSKISFQLVEKKFTLINKNFFKSRSQKFFFFLITFVIIISSFSSINFVNKSLSTQKKKLDELNTLSKKFKEYTLNSTSYKYYNFLNKNIKKCIFQNFDKEKIMSNCYSKKNNKELLFFVGDSHAASIIMLTQKKYDHYDVILAANSGGLFSHFFYKIDGDIINDQSLTISKKYNNFFLESWKLFKELSSNYQKSNLIISSDYLTHINDNIILDKNYLQLNNKSKILELYAEELVNLSENLVDDEEIIFIKNIPQPSFSSFDCLKQVIFQKKEKSLCNYDRNFYGPDKTFNTLLTKRKNNLRLYDFGEKFCNINDCRFFNIKNNYNIIINDKSHITLQSVELFEDDFFNFIQTN